MKCKYCGAEIANDSTFCEHCGKQVGKDKAKRSKLFLVFGGIAIIAACVCVTLFYAFRSPKARNDTAEQQQAILEFDTDGPIAFSGHSMSSSKVISVGDSYSTRLMVAAFNPSMKMDVYYKVGVDTLTEEQEGDATHVDGPCTGVELELPGGGVGTHKIAGYIKVKTEEGIELYPFRDEYQVVANSGATVSIDKLNVLYAGIPNPITVSGNSTAVSFSGCTVKSNGAGKYDVTVPTSLIGKMVTASVDGSNGNNTSQFRVKKVPDPTPYLGTHILGGKRSKSELLSNPFISARMGDDFAYDLKWTIKSYRLTVVSKGIEGAPKNVVGAQFDGSVTDAINSASAGTVLVFSDIKATSIVGERTLRDITVRIK